MRKKLKRRIYLPEKPLLGVCATSTEDFIFVPLSFPNDIINDINESLNVSDIPILIGGSFLVGSLLQGNSNGAIVAGFINDDELKQIEKHLKVSILTDRLNAAGNIILTNDTAALIHPDFSDKTVNKIKETLDIDVKKGTIAGLKTVGMAGVATNKGLIVHPDIREEEIGILEDLFGLPIETGTVNFGSPLVGSGLLANTKGYVVGVETTGIEISKIEDFLGMISGKISSY